jgi:hypothetical protein
MRWVGWEEERVRGMILHTQPVTIQARAARMLYLINPIQTAPLTHTLDLAHIFQGCLEYI